MRAIFNFLFIIIFTGCGDFFESQSDPLTTENLSSQASIDFEEVKQKIFEPFCIRCHINYGNFASVKINISEILISIEQNRMPRNSPPLEEELKNLLRTWVAEGAQEFQNDAPQEQPIDQDPAVLKPTWESLSLHIFEPKCLVCHSPNGKAPWVDFSSRSAMAKTLLKHINFENPDNSNLIIRLRDPEEPMPPLPPQSNLSQLTPEEVLVVIEWINSGLP